MNLYTGVCHHVLIVLYSDVRPILQLRIVNHLLWWKVLKVQGSLLFVTYTIIQGIISSEMLGLA